MPKKDEKYWWLDNKGNWHYHKPGTPPADNPVKTSSTKPPASSGNATGKSSDDPYESDWRKYQRQSQKRFKQGTKALQKEYGDKTRRKVYGPTPQLSERDKTRVAQLRERLSESRESRFKSKAALQAIRERVTAGEEVTPDELTAAREAHQKAKSQHLRKRGKLENLTGRTREERQKALEDIGYREPKAGEKQPKPQPTPGEGGTRTVPQGTQNPTRPLPDKSQGQTNDPNLLRKSSGYSEARKRVLKRRKAKVGG